MEFRIQEILKNIIPGTILTILVGVVCYRNGSSLDTHVTNALKDFSEFFMVLFLAALYFLGFLIDAIAAMLEDWIYKIRKRPSFIILSGIASPKYSLTNRAELVLFLNNKSELPMGSSLDRKNCYIFFKVANRLKDISGSDIIKEKLGEYYNSYIFARNVTCVCLIGWSFNLVLLFSNWSSLFWVFVIQSGIFFIVVIRLNRRAMYYTLQVFNAVTTP